MDNLTNELRGLQFASYPEIFKKFKALSDKYGGMTSGQLINAFTRVSGQMYDRNNPYIQNRRVKQISSLPADFTKDQVGEMLRAPENNEQALRQVEHGLEYTAYPLFHMKKVYQDLLTYHNYISPCLPEKGAEKKDNFWREWRLLEKLRKELNPGRFAHQAVGQAIQEGKVFYIPRVKVDKSHNKVLYAFMQQLPSDWTKIVGFNNKSKYTVAFNLFYFMQPGTDPLQFGDLFLPYLDTFGQVTTATPPAGTGTSIVYASKAGVDFQRFQKLRQAAKGGKLDGDPDVYYQNGTWFYWVTLPVESVWTFEIDDTSRTAVSPFTGLFLSLIQLAQYEQVQLEIVQNPLVSLVTGEIPYRDDKDAATSDPYKLSNAGREFFEALWYQMLSATNTSGIGLYMAPLENMTLHTLSEAPSAMEISSNGYEYTISKAGLAGIMPSSSDTRAGMAQISLSIESRFGKCVYKTTEAMMENIFSGLGLNYEWNFRMFGDLATDATEKEELRKDMTLGILPSTMKFLAMQDMSILDDMAISGAIAESGLLDLRMPLVSSYSAKQGESGLPPEAKHDLNPGGRPDNGGKAVTDGGENDADSFSGPNAGTEPGPAARQA